MARKMSDRSWVQAVVSSLMVSTLCVVGCAKPKEDTGGSTATPHVPQASDAKPSTPATANAADVKAARAKIDSLGSRSSYKPKDGNLLTEIVIQDGSNLTAEDIQLFGKLSDLEKLHILNCRALNDEMAAHLSTLKNLKSLALTNTVINDSTVEMIVKSFPNLTELDLSSNTNMTTGVMKIISELSKLQKLTLVQNRVNDISAQRISKLQELRALDLRGNMEAGDMALDVVSELPKLTALKHRSTAVSDAGMESLSKNQTLDSLLIQDFAITDQSGPHIAKLGKLTQLEVFRCAGFGSEGVLALKGMGLTRLTLRDLPNVSDQGLEALDDLPKLKRLYLHELSSVSDSGLAHLAVLQSLELLDIWTVTQMTDATIDVIAKLPNLKSLAIRTTGVTDAAIDKLLAMPKLESLTFKENGSVTADGLKKLATRKWSSLDIGASSNSDEGGAP